MRAAVLHAGGVIRTVTRPTPPPTPGEVLLRVTLAGICGTDLELARGYKANAQVGCVLGHEFVGVIARRPPPLVPPVADTTATETNTDAAADAAAAAAAAAAEATAAADACPPLGTRVVAEINCVTAADAVAAAAAGPDAVAEGGGIDVDAGTTSAGRAHHPRRTVVGIGGRDGAWATYVSVPVANVHPVPDVLPDTVAVATEPFAAATAAAAVVAETLRPGGGRVAVLGAGRLGVLVALALRMALPEGRTGITVLVRSTAGSPRTARAAEVLERAAIPLAPVGGGPYAAVVDCTGGPDGVATALSLVRPTGLVVVKSTFAPPPSTSAESTARAAAPAGGLTAAHLVDLVVREVRLVGSRCGNFRVALAAATAAPVGWLDGWVSTTYDLEDAADAVAAAAVPGALKVLLRMPEAEAAASEGEGGT
ncbi:hypothetical protein MMPV_003969 [Pyropia vietnamensis]